MCGVHDCPFSGRDGTSKRQRGALLELLALMKVSLACLLVSCCGNVGQRAAETLPSEFLADDAKVKDQLVLTESCWFSMSGGGVRSRCWQGSRHVTGREEVPWVRRSGAFGSKTSKLSGCARGHGRAVGLGLKRSP